MGQFYKPLSVGTAKPDWQNSSVPHHLFDIISEPENISVAKYRNLVLQKIREVSDKNKLPIIVGGSLFYLKSLFYPPVEFPPVEFPPVKLPQAVTLWDSLNKVDPDRAKQIHPNDTYRLSRALEIWKQTGNLPSSYVPKFNLEFETLFLFLNPDKVSLRENINERTEIMINQEGWIEEVEKIIGTEWEEFLKIKKLIGYPEIINWIKSGKINTDLPGVIEDIKKSTWTYARRQNIFWKNLKKQFEAVNNNGLKLNTISSTSIQDISIKDICPKLSSKFF